VYASEACAFGCFLFSLSFLPGYGHAAHALEMQLWPFKSLCSQLDYIYMCNMT